MPSGERGERTLRIVTPSLLLKLYGLSSPKYTESLSRRFSAHTEINLSPSYSWNSLVKFGRGGGGKAIKSAIVCDQPFLFSFFLVGSLFRRSEKNFFLLRILIRFKWISFGGRKNGRVEIYGERESDCKLAINRSR